MARKVPRCRLTNFQIKENRFLEAGSIPLSSFACMRNPTRKGSSNHISEWHKDTIFLIFMRMSREEESRINWPVQVGARYATTFIPKQSEELVLGRRQSSRGCDAANGCVLL